MMKNERWFFAENDEGSDDRTGPQVFVLVSPSQSKKSHPIPASQGTGKAGWIDANVVIIEEG